MAGNNRQPGGANPRSQEISRGIMKRVQFLYVLLVVVAIAIFAMILTIQFGPNGTPLRNLSDSTCYRILPVAASRGNIYARDGSIMAADSPFYDITLDFTVLDMPAAEFDKLARALADSLNRVVPVHSRDYYLSRLREIKAKADRGGAGSRNQSLMRERVNQVQLDRMKTFPIFDKGRLGGGFIYSKNTERYRPFGTLAARTLGRPQELKSAGSDPADTIARRGFGLEHSFDYALAGRPGRNKCVRLVRDEWVPVVDRDNVEAVNGSDIITTIDIHMQDIVERALRRQLVDNNAIAGTAVIMDVETGEIRAISNLTRYSDGSIADDVNHAITMRVEPGSTFKLVSLMALLEEAGYDLDMMVDCTKEGKYYYQPKPNGRKYLVEDDHDDIGVISLKGVMAQSSNIGFVKTITGEYGEEPERFVDFIEGLGIDRPISMQLQGGAKPVIKDPRRRKETAWDDISLMKMSYGYALELTPIHTLMLYNAVANGGEMVAPRLVTAITGNGHVAQRFEKEVINPEICSGETILKLRESLEEVVVSGTGSALKDKAYKAAGKTGTAQMVLPGGGYTDSRGGRQYLASFAGYFPADKPKYSCIVAIKTYNGPGARNPYHGAQVALPAFRTIADKVYALDDSWLAEIEPRTVADTVPVKGGSLREIYTASEELDIETDLGRRSRGWGLTKSEAANVEVVAFTQQTDTVPSVMGMGLKDAVFLLERQGMEVKFSGKGRVVNQSVKAGSPVRDGAAVTLTLK